MNTSAATQRADELVDDLMALAGASMQPDPYLIQSRFRDALVRYVRDRVRPGGFLTAVLSNDLFGAIQRGDSRALANLPHVVAYVYSELPAICWGTPGRVQEWLREDAA